MTSTDKAMNVSVLTLFPDLVAHVLDSSIIGRAWRAGRFTIDLVDIRDFAINAYGTVDDACYGGGRGMLLMAEPIYQAWCAVTGQPPQADLTHQPQRPPGTWTVFLSPAGKVFTQARAQRLAGDVRHLILICGHYEGIDRRVIDRVVDEELSIGDYVITGGELAACVLADAVLRLLPGVLPDEAAFMNESHMGQGLEHPHYTRPATWRGLAVPDVLTSGHQAKIAGWQRAASVRQTGQVRPDLLNDQPLTADQWRQVLTHWPQKKDDKKHG